MDSTWEPRASESLELPPGAAHVWRVAVPEEEAGAAAAVLHWSRFLAPDERARNQRFHFAADAARHAAGRAALRILLGSYLRCSWETLTFAAGPTGKPRLRPQETAHASIEFNVSHSGKWVLLAFTSVGAVGIDIERHREIEAEALIRRFFHANEAARWSALGAEVRMPAFFELWALKEAYLKATGRGLSKDPRSFEVGAVPTGGDPRLLWCADDPDPQAHWRLRRIAVEPGYAAAAAVPRRCSGMDCFTFVA